MDKPRSASLPLAPSSPMPMGGPLEDMAVFVDADGVLRRSSSVTRRMVLRGASVGKAEFLRGAAPLDDAKAPTETQPPAPAPAPTPAPASPDWKQRRSQFIGETRRSKRQLLLESNAALEERTQRWADASAHDPAAETTSAHSAQCPSPRAQSFVDAEGNVRRKREDVAGAREDGGPAAAAAAAAAAGPPSCVLEFLQAIIDD